MKCGARLRVILLCGALAGCGSRALVPRDGGGDAPATPEAASEAAPSQTDGAAEAAPSLARMRSTVGTMAFNEPMNDGFERDLIPTWSSPGVRASADGRITATIATSFVGPLPDADQRREVLFWNVTGQFPSGQDAESIAMSEVYGVVATSSNDRSAAFFIDGAFDPTVRSGAGDVPFELDVGLTWVRVVKKSGVLIFQVLPGRRDAFSPDHQLGWDDTPQALDGPFGYYGPLTDDTPGLGTSFDYPAWIRAHVTW